MSPLLLHASSRSQNPGHRRVLHIEYAAFSLPPELQWSEAVKGSLPSATELEDCSRSCMMDTIPNARVRMSLLPRLFGRDRYDEAACIRILFDRTQSLAERGAAAESLYTGQTPTAAAALLRFILDETEDSSLREEAGPRFISRPGTVMIKLSRTFCNEALTRGWTR
jgi:hypothetical protein